MLLRTGPAFASDHQALANPKSCFKCTSAPRMSHSVTRCSIEQAETSRRQLLQGASLMLLGSMASSTAQALPASKGQTPGVGSYLPPAPGSSDGYVEYKPDAKKTPTIRAGIIKPNDAYKFALPPTWKEQRISNTMTGNFCVPNCGEPWLEAVFEGSEGKVQLLAMNLQKLTNKAGASIEDIGPPSGILESLGAYITGTRVEEEDVVSQDKVSHDGRMYYTYEVNSLAGLNPPHSYTVATTKGQIAYLLIVNANDKQWGKDKAKLKKVAESFRV